MLMDAVYKQNKIFIIISVVVVVVAELKVSSQKTIQHNIMNSMLLICEY